MGRELGGTDKILLLHFTKVGAVPPTFYNSTDINKTKLKILGSLKVTNKFLRDVYFMNPSFHFL